MNSLIQYRSAFKTLVTAWSLQTLVLALNMVMLLAGMQESAETFLKMTFMIDLPIFALFIVWSIVELVKTIRSGELQWSAVIAQILCVVGAGTFLGAALAYRQVLGLFPENPLSSYFIEVFGLSAVKAPDQLIDTSGITNTINGLAYANVGLLIFSIGLAFFGETNGEKTYIVMYGLFNLGITLTIFLAILKPIITVPFLFLYLRYQTSSETEVE